jgi:hypothetical protein
MMSEKKTAEEVVKEAQEKIKESKKEHKNVVFNITNVIKQTTTSTAHAYKKNIDSVLGLLSYALFASAIYQGTGIYNADANASILKLLFDLFCAITLIVAKHRVKKGDLSKFFDMTHNEKSKDASIFFAEEDAGETYIHKFD